MTEKSTGTKEPDTADIPPVALPVLSGHRLAGKVQRQRVDLAVGINVDQFYAATGLMLDVPTFRQMVADTVFMALDAIPGATVDKFPSADFETGMNGYGYEESLDLSLIDWCHTLLHADDCPAHEPTPAETPVA